jgi:hypothetical protein
MLKVLNHLIILGFSCKYLLDKRETKALIMNSEPVSSEKVDILKRDVNSGETENIRTSVSITKKDDDYQLKEISKQHNESEIEELRASESLVLFRPKQRLLSKTSRNNMDTEDVSVKHPRSSRKYILISNCTSKLIIKRIKKKKANMDSGKFNHHRLNTTNKQICFDLGQSLKELQ